MDSAHGLQLDKRVFILATAALLSAFAAPHPRCFLWQSWPKHCRPERAAVRGERRPAGSKKRDWWWSKWRDGETLTMRLALCVFESASLNSRWCGSASSLWSKLRYKKKKALINFNFWWSCWATRRGGRGFFFFYFWWLCPMQLFLYFNHITPCSADALGSKSVVSWVFNYSDCWLICWLISRLISKCGDVLKLLKILRH